MRVLCVVGIFLVAGIFDGIFRRPAEFALEEIGVCIKLCVYFAIVMFGDHCLLKFWTFVWDTRTDITEFRNTQTTLIGCLFYQTNILKQFLSGEVLHDSLLQLLLEHGDLLNVDISQSSLATCLRCGGIFKYDFITHLLHSLTVKEFWK